MVFFFFQRCVPQVERDVHCARDVSFGSEVCLQHVIRNTLLHCEPSEQHHYAKHNITWRSQTSLKSPNYSKISRIAKVRSFFFFYELHIGNLIGRRHNDWRRGSALDKTRQIGYNYDIKFLQGGIVRILNTSGTTVQWQKFHVERGRIFTIAKIEFDIFDVAESIYRKIMEW